MKRDELLQRIDTLSVWKKGDQRAPHKPLLILYALSRLINDNIEAIKYEVLKEDLKNLLIDFGPIRKSYHPEQPFVRLENDGIWLISHKVNKRSFSSNELLRNDVSGGFSPEVSSLLKSEPKLVQEIAERLLNDHFPETIHEDILRAIALDLDNIQKKRKRDPRFREKILQAYEYCCAICEFNVRLGNNLVGVEAAHIKWHQAGGPDIEENGIALCSMHHKLFDRGVFTLTENREILVAEKAYGTNGFNEWLMKYHGKEIKRPISPIYQPNTNYLGWHAREVFKGPARYQVI